MGSTSRTAIAPTEWCHFHRLGSPSVNESPAHGVPDELFEKLSERERAGNGVASNRARPGRVVGCLVRARIGALVSGAPALRHSE